MKRIILIVLAPLALLAAGCASQGSLDMVRTDVDAMKARMFTMEKDLSGLRDESKEGLGTIAKEYRAEVASVRKLSADLQATIDGLKADLQAMNGKVDDTSIAARKPAEDLARYREDADKRIVILEDRIVKLQTTVDALNKKISETPALKEEPDSAEAAYARGLEAFKAGDMAGAREKFSKFIEQFPQHDLAANAQYWIGETFYSEKSYEAAILAYQEVIKQYPKKEKAPAAMLKQAMAFKAIRDIKSARYVLKKLMETYPKSADAKKAKELLKELK